MCSHAVSTLLVLWWSLSCINIRQGFGNVNHQSVCHWFWDCWLPHRRWLSDESPGLSSKTWEMEHGIELAVITRIWLQTGRTSNTCMCVCESACVCQCPPCACRSVWRCLCCTFFCVFIRHYGAFETKCVYVCVCLCLRLCVFSAKPSHFSPNDTVCCCWGHGIWTYVHLSFDEQKLRPEERGQHLDRGIHQRE